MTTVLLIGGSGFIGANIAHNFERNGFNVIVLDIDNANFENLKLLEQKIKIYKGNFNNEEVIENIFKNEKIDVVIDLVTTILPGSELNNVEKEININLLSVAKLLDKMKKYSVNKIVFFSSGGTVYGKSKDGINSETHETDPINFYGWTKLAIEKYIQMYSNLKGIEYIIVRPSNPYGKFQNIFGKQGLIAVIIGKIIKEEKLEIWGDGNIVRDYIFIEDLCEAVLLLLQNKKWNQVYNIGSEIGFSINEVIRTIEEVIEKKVLLEYKEKRKVDVEKNILKISKLQKDTGFNISTDLKTGIKKMWDEIIKERYNAAE